jgi:uncharacterized protein involved in exopolysaccharide biosynthesis
VEEVNLLDFLEVLKRQWRVAALVVALVVAVAGLVTVFVLPRQYTASASLIIPDSRSSLPMSLGGAASTLPMLSFLSLGRPPSQWQIMSVLQSNTAAREVCEKLGLKRVYDVPDDYRAAETLKKGLRVTWTETGAISIIVTTVGTPRGLVAKSENDADVRKRAADIANAYIAVLREWLRDNAIDETTQRARDAERQRKRMQDESEKAQRALRDFKQTHGIVSLPDELQAQIKTYADLSAQLVATKAEADSARAAERSAASSASEYYAHPPEALPPAEAGAQVLGAQLAQARADLDDARAVYRDEHSTVRDLKQKVVALEKAYGQAQARAARAATSGLDPGLADLAAKAAGARARLSAIQAKLHGIESQFATAPELELQYGQLALQAETKRAIAEQLEIQATTQRVLFDSSDKFTVLDEAYPPFLRSRPKLKVNLMVAFVLGLFLGCAAAAVRDRRTRPRPAPTLAASPAQEAAQ